MTTTSAPIEADTHADPGLWIVATSTPPEIVCPPWCVDTDDHLAHLSDYEGRVVHTSRPIHQVGQAGDLWLRMETLVDGTPAPGPRGEIRVTGDLMGDDLSLVDIEGHANDLLELVRGARR